VACFGTNLQLHAGKKNIKLDPNFSVTADVSLCARDDGGLSLEVELKVNLPGINKAEAEAFVVQADQYLPLFPRDPRQCSGQDHSGVTNLKPSVLVAPLQMKGTV
jgi:hypothetical protein